MSELKPQAGLSNKKGSWQEILARLKEKSSYSNSRDVLNATFSFDVHSAVISRLNFFSFFMKRFRWPQS
jgi:hypothetical protein